MPPEITIRPSIEPIEFLRKFDEILRDDANVKVKSFFKLEGIHEAYQVSFLPKNETEHDGLVLFLHFWPDKPPIIQVSAIANRWNPLMSYETYVSSVDKYITPYLKKYNQRLKTRLTLRIPSKKSTLPKLTPALQRDFDRFEALANKNAPHTYDWNRFYHFIKRSYSLQPDLDQSDVRYFLHSSGFSKEMSDVLSEIFYHCREFYIETDWKRSRSRRKKNNKS